MKDAVTQPGSTWFVSEILKWQLVEPQGSILGRVRDLTADVREHEPPITGLVLTDPRKNLHFLPWSLIEELVPRTVRVKSGARAALRLLQLGPGEILLSKGLLDKQIVDTAGAKVVRVNDLQLRERSGVWVLSKVDVGFRGLMRRVGLERFTDTVLNWLLSYTPSENLIAWQLVQAVGSADILRLRLSQSRLARLHPADLADIIEDLDLPERSRVFSALDIDMAADTLEETDPKVQVSLIQSLPTENASDILEQMSPDEAADILQILDKDHAEGLLQVMEPERAEDVRSLLEHDQETAGGLMTTAFCSLPPDYTVERALNVLRQEAEGLDVLYYIYVEDVLGRLIGVVGLRELLLADPQTKLESIMTTRLVSVNLDADKEDIAELFAKYWLGAIPVLNGLGRIHGVVRFKTLLEVAAPHLGR
jgi:sporulation protein YlmC with PRC-barrel domain